VTQSAVSPYELLLRRTLTLQYFVAFVDERLPKLSRLHLELTLKLAHPRRQPIVRRVKGRNHVLVVDPGGGLERRHAEDLFLDLVLKPLIFP
jgi:hypothetical protein